MFRSIDKWLPGYLASVVRRPRNVTGMRHVLFCAADHFEPLRRSIGEDGVARGGRNSSEAQDLVAEWLNGYQASVAGLRDGDGMPPRHTFFCPQEEYDPVCLDLLAGAAAEGLGEVEIHLHHRNDTGEGLRGKLISFRDTLRQEHGLLGSWTRKARLLDRINGMNRIGNVIGRESDELLTNSRSQSTAPAKGCAFGFVHGNWSLCNSRPDGDWCGVNEELGVLAEAGCYADFTFPSVPSPTQPKMVNCIYRAWDRPGRPRGHDSGFKCRVANGKEREAGLIGQDEPCLWHGKRNQQDREPGRSGRERRGGLMLIQGPMGLNWADRKFGVLPRLENADISKANPPSPERADLWVRQGIHVCGRPEWVFVKVHTHGCIQSNADVLFGSEMRRTRQYMDSHYDDGRQWRLHYVTAREMYNIIRAAEDGMTGSPGDYRDYEISPPPVVT